MERLDGCDSSHHRRPAPFIGGRSTVDDGFRAGSAHLEAFHGVAELSDGIQLQIEKKSLSWAFRATDAKNYYATKILITKPGPLPNAGLVRYVVINGHEWDRVQLPLPLTLERGGNYRVRVSVQDDHFITYLNGQVISSWSDKRLLRGGVGFFDDVEDPQKVAWVNLSERDSFMGRMLAHFSLFVMPGELLQSGPLQ